MRKNKYKEIQHYLVYTVNLQPFSILSMILATILTLQENPDLSLQKKKTN